MNCFIGWLLSRAVLAAAVAAAEVICQFFVIGDDIIKSSNNPTLFSAVQA
jgi:hypothetical protein